ncbi:MAG: orotidine-5'-phosphate decarboxylase [Ruminococcus sp.]|jgi:orotidine-5'-phosphate decarboxylase|nr:orotidine-5'-phosphate decarboxylase [Ruminococcus sp.]
MSIDNLIENIKLKKSPIVVGLDPKFENLPKYIQERYIDDDGLTLETAAKSIYKFNRMLIDAVYDLVPAIKPQIAYYEMYGHYGLRAFELTVKYAKTKGLYVIADAKRNDIGTTCEAYAKAYLGNVSIGETVCTPVGADALTVNAYLGYDGVKPFLDVCKELDKSIFVLAKTSNKSSGELQDLEVDKKPVYEIMGEYCEEWGKGSVGKNGYSAVGAVVGATYPEQLTALRKKLPHTFFLIPGYGAQGGTAADIKGAFDGDGIGGIVNSSRGIIYAYMKEGCDEREFAEAARREVIRMKLELNATA